MLGIDDLEGFAPVQNCERGYQTGQLARAEQMV